MCTGTRGNVPVSLPFNAVHFIAAIVLLFIVDVPGVIADQTSTSRTDKSGPVRWQLDLPAQPIEEAFYRLGVVTGVQIFADGKIVAGRKTRAISGEYTAGEALERLLSGTGLVARSAGAGAIMVVLGLTEAEGEAVRLTYSTRLQHAVLAALCRDGEISLGGYRLAFRMWLTQQGLVERIDLLSSTGDAQRDRRLSRILSNVVAEQPPKALPQPVIMVILPRLPQDSGDCTPPTSPVSLQ